MSSNLPATGKEFGPAMCALRPQQQVFVMAYFENGGNATEAARMAGYKDESKGSINVTAHRLLRRTDVKTAMQEEARSRLVDHLPLADKAVREIVSASEPKDRLKAAAMIFNRAGVHEVVERNVNVNVTMTSAEKVAEIRQMAETLGLDPEKLLGTVVDGEFEEVPEGLEDVW